MMEAAMRARCLIVIGASAGGLRAIGKIARSLPCTLPACVLVVLHIAQSSRGMLASVLSRYSTLPVKQAEDGDPIRSGRIYVARPDYHLLVGSQGLELNQHPKVNRARPAIDPLFRSAAALYGKRVIGVVLTGFLQDGSAGLIAIKQAGGVTIVQDPADAEFPDMPETALERAQVDYCARLSEMPALLAQLASRADVGESPINGEARLVSLATPHSQAPDRTALAVLQAQNRRVDDSLSIAASALEERADLLALMAENERMAQSESQAREYGVRELRSRQDAARLRAIATSAPKSPS